MAQRPHRHLLRLLAGIATVVVASGILFGSTSQAAPSAALEVVNPSFEETNADGTPAGWAWQETPACGRTVVTTTEDARTGQRSAKFTDATTGGTVCLLTNHVKVSPGQKVTASIWMKQVSGTPTWMYLRFWDRTGAMVGDASVRPQPSTTWKQESLSTVAGEAAVTATLMLYGGTTTSGVTLLDDASMSGSVYDPVIGQYRQLFVDDYRIASMSPDVQRVVHPGTRSDVTLVADKPWESSTYVYNGTVLWNPDLKRYQAWYGSWSPGFTTNLGMYAESVNGRVWHKPNLGLVEYQGSKDNNIYSMHGPGTVLYDPADPDPQRRYKRLVFIGSPRGYHAFFSPDGRRWTASPQNPVIANGDVSNVAWDPYRGRFVAITKQPMPKTPEGHENRVQFISFSSDFEEWTAPVRTLAADARDKARGTANGAVDMQVYGLTVAAYEGVYLGFPWLFQIGGQGLPDTGGDGVIDVQVAISRDLDGEWQRPARDPVIPRGEAGDRDDGMTLNSSQLIVGRDTVQIYYTGWNGTHGVFDRTTANSIATWRLDGFVSLRNSGDNPGTVTTRPVRIDGSKLHVNAAVRPGGAITVELVGSDGAPIPGFTAAQAKPVRGSQVDQVVSWDAGADLSSLRGQEVSLRFTLKGADLYSFAVR